MTKKKLKNSKPKITCLSISVSQSKEFQTIDQIKQKNMLFSKHGQCSLKKQKNLNAQTNNWKLMGKN